MNTVPGSSPSAAHAAYEIVAAPAGAWRRFDPHHPDPGCYEFDWLSSQHPDLYYAFALSTEGLTAELAACRSARPDSHRYGCQGPDDPPSGCPGRQHTSLPWTPTQPAARPGRAAKHPPRGRRTGQRHLSPSAEPACTGYPGGQGLLGSIVTGQLQDNIGAALTIDPSALPGRAGLQIAATNSPDSPGPGYWINTRLIQSSQQCTCS